MKMISELSSILPLIWSCDKLSVRVFFFIFLPFLFMQCCKTVVKQLFSSMIGGLNHLSAVVPVTSLRVLSIAGVRSPSLTSFCMINHIILSTLSLSKMVMSIKNRISTLTVYLLLS